MVSKPSELKYAAFLEANAILAAQEQDWEELDRTIRLMYPGERLALRHAAVRLARALKAGKYLLTEGK